MKVRVELELDWPDVRVLDMISQQLQLDPEATIRFLIRKGLEALTRPSEMNQQPENLRDQTPKDIRGMEITADEDKK